MKAKIYTILLTALFFTSCSDREKKQEVVETENKNSEKQLLFDKLIGVWKNTDGKNFEQWIKNTDGSYSSFGFQMNGNDTVYAERVKVVFQDGNWHSENTAPGQNQGKAIRFDVVQLSDTELHFSNPKHDFPTDIHYTFTDDNTLHAYIAGPNASGGRDTIPFYFSRFVQNH